MTTQTAWDRRSPEQLQAAFALMRHANYLEQMGSIPASDHGSTSKSLQINPLDIQIRQVYPFGTSDVTVSKSGLVLTVRRVRNKISDSVVKLRPVHPGLVWQKQPGLPRLGVELDSPIGSLVCSRSTKGTIDPGIHRDFAAAKARKVCFCGQRDFFDAREIKFGGLGTLDPIFVLTQRFVSKELKRRVVFAL